jgi:hypothetical protein
VSIEGAVLMDAPGEEAISIEEYLESSSAISTPVPAIRISWV